MGVESQRFSLAGVWALAASNEAPQDENSTIIHGESKGKWKSIMEGLRFGDPGFGVESLEF